MSGKRDQEEENLRTSGVFVTLVRVGTVGAGMRRCTQCLSWGK
ncbi:hypothetical protein [Paraburkholderia panacisoli]|nr:hypothetical protein [Paraburkholderia panacisoli]